MNKVYTNIHQDLIDACARNSRHAQTELYKLYYKAMFNTSLRMVNDPMEAEDIMQEAFLSAFEKIKTYSGEVSFGAWLKRIVVNRSLDHIRKNKMQFDEINDKHEIAEEEVAIENSEETNATVEQIKQAMQQLSDGYRVILSLYLLEGYDHEEIGDILEISSSTSRSQYTRAKRKLLEIMN